jgi:hypothetical protein
MGSLALGHHALVSVYVCNELVYFFVTSPLSSASQVLLPYLWVILYCLFTVTIFMT